MQSSHHVDETFVGGPDKIGQLPARSGFGDLHQSLGDLTRRDGPDQHRGNHRDRPERRSLHHLSGEFVELGRSLNRPWDRPCRNFPFCASLPA